MISEGCSFRMKRGIRSGTGRHVFQKELAKLAAEGVTDLSPRMLLLGKDMASELKVINELVTSIIKGFGPPCSAATLTIIRANKAFSFQSFQRL